MFSPASRRRLRIRRSRLTRFTIRRRDNARGGWEKMSVSKAFSGAVRVLRTIATRIHVRKQFLYRFSDTLSSLLSSIILALISGHVSRKLSKRL